jgi:hypothetical protein
VHQVESRQFGPFTFRTEPAEPEGLGPEAKLRHLSNVMSSILAQAMDSWTELWGEFEDRMTSGVLVLPNAEEGFTPECGWAEFLERMWELRFYLASAQKFCQQRARDL